MREFISLLLLSGCAAAALAREESRKDFVKTAALAGGKTLRVDHSHGSVTIRATPQPEASIRATIRCSAPTADRARACADRIQISVEESASGVSVRTIYPHSEGRDHLSYGVDYDISMSDAAPLDVRNRFGPVSVADLKAAANINNSNGPVAFLRGRGEQRITNAFGEVEVRSNDGDVTVVNGNGEVRVSDVTGRLDISNRFARVQATNTGKGLTIRASNAEVIATRVGGAVSIDNSFGRVNVSEAKGDVTVNNQNGEISVQGIGGAAILNTTFSPIRFSKIGRGVSVRAQNATITGDTVNESATIGTSFGGIDLRDVKGAVRATTSNGPVRISGAGGQVYARATFNGVTITDAIGPITVESRNGSVTVEPRRAQKCQPIVLGTSFGPIRVALPAGLGYDLAASTSFGKIHSEHEIAVTGEVSTHALTGRIGGGGCELRLVNRNGAIDVVKSSLKR